MILISAISCTLHDKVIPKSLHCCIIRNSILVFHIFLKFAPQQTTAFLLHLIFVTYPAKFYLFFLLYHFSVYHLRLISCISFYIFNFFFLVKTWDNCSILLKWISQVYITFVDKSASVLALFLPSTQCRYAAKKLFKMYFK